MRELTGSALADVTVEASGLVRRHVPRAAAHPSRRHGAAGRTAEEGGVLQRGRPHPPRDRRDDHGGARVRPNLPAALALLADRDLAALLVEKVVPLERAVEEALVPMAEGAARGKLLVDPQVAP